MEMSNKEKKSQIVKDVTCSALEFIQAELKINTSGLTDREKAAVYINIIVNLTSLMIANLSSSTEFCPSEFYTEMEFEDAFRESIKIYDGHYHERKKIRQDSMGEVIAAMTKIVKGIKDEQ